MECIGGQQIVVDCSELYDGGRLNDARYGCVEPDCLDVPENIHVVYRNEKPGHVAFEESFKTVKIVCDGGYKIDDIRSPWKRYTETARRDTDWIIEYDAPSFFFDEDRDGDRVGIVTFSDIPVKYWRRAYLRLSHGDLTSRRSRGILSHVALSLYASVEENRYTYVGSGRIVPYLSPARHKPLVLLESEHRELDALLWHPDVNVYACDITNKNRLYVYNSLNNTFEQNDQYPVLVSGQAYFITAPRAGEFAYSDNVWILLTYNEVVSITDFDSSSSLLGYSFSSDIYDEAAFVLCLKSVDQLCYYERIGYIIDEYYLGPMGHVCINGVNVFGKLPCVTDQEMYTSTPGSGITCSQLRFDPPRWWDATSRTVRTDTHKPRRYMSVNARSQVDRLLKRAVPSKTRI